MATELKLGRMQDESKDMAEDRNEFVQGLARGLAVINAFDEDHGTMTLTNVAQRAGISPAAARRSLHTLIALGYVRQVGKQFVLTAKVLSLATPFLRAANIGELLQPELRRLVHLFGDSSAITVLRNFEVLYIAHHSEQKASRSEARIGMSLPAYATSTGRVLLSAMSDFELAAYFAAHPPRSLTEFTVTDVARLSEVIKRVRNDDYATAVDEYDYGVTALAVPIRNREGQIVAALNSSGYTGKTSIESMISERLGEMKTAASSIERNLESHKVLMWSLG